MALEQLVYIHIHIAALPTSYIERIAKKNIWIMWCIDCEICRYWKYDQANVKETIFTVEWLHAYAYAYAHACA